MLVKYANFVTIQRIAPDKRVRPKASNLLELSPGLPPTHPETSTTSESVWASLLNEREDPRPREETPGREGGC